MALTYTPSGELGSPLPDFKLKAVDGSNVGREDYRRMQPKALVVMFICNHCPYVQAIEDRLLGLAHEYRDKGVGFIGVCANDANSHPDDSPQALRERWKSKN